MTVPGTARGVRIEFESDPDNRPAIRHALGALSALVPVGVFATDADGTCWYVNQRLVVALGLETQGRGSRPLRLDLPPDEPPGLCVLGTPTRLAVRVMPLVQPNGDVASYIGIVVDDDKEAARLLHPSDDLVDILVDRSPEVMTILNEDGSWRYSNAQAWRLLGYRVAFDPIAGMMDLVHPEDAPLAKEAFERVRAGEPASEDSLELRMRAADGTWHLLECEIENLLDDPVVHGFLMRSRDVTEQRAARQALVEANHRLSTLIGSLQLAVLLEDAERRIVFTNNAFVTLFELSISPTQMVGRTIVELGGEFFRRFGDPTVAGPSGRTREILRAKKTVIGDRIELGDGRVIERDYVPVMIEGQYHGHVWSFRDVSAQAHAEVEWESLLSRQRRENERLLELDRVKAAFLAEISHELRTPLTSIMSFAELLSEGLERDDPAEQAEFLEIIQRNAERLLRLVDDLLLLDRIESGSMPLEWGIVDVPSLIAACIASFSPSAESKSVSLEIEIGEGPSIPGDQGRLAQVVDILLSNALKFTPEQGRIVLTAAPVDRLWKLEVADNGIGVPQKEQASLFQRFYRATNARVSRIPGSGLGLPVAKAIAELHGGSIALRSTEGGGTTVTVKLPFDPAGMQERAGSERAAAS